MCRLTVLWLYRGAMTHEKFHICLEVPPLEPSRGPQAPWRISKLRASPFASRCHLPCFVHIQLAGLPIPDRRTDKELYGKFQSRRVFRYGEFLETMK